MTEACFTYVPREFCVCGNPLDASEMVVEKAFAWGNIRFVRCAQCRSWVQSPQVSLDSLASWFDSEDYQAAGASRDGAYLDYASVEQQRREEAFDRYRRDLRPILPERAKVLEIGCASGSLLSVLAEAGHRVRGIDLSPKFAEQARSLYDLNVEVGDFLTFEDSEEPFDIIMMLGTLSNLQDVGRHLEHAAGLLKPHGWLYFNTPLADSIVARLYGTSFWMFAPSVAIFYTEPGLRSALDRAGFKVATMRNDRQKPTVSKLLGHARLQRLYPLASGLGLTRLAAPFSLPIPGIVAVWARSGR